MKNWILLFLILFSVTMCNSNPKEPVVILQTSYGNIKLKLYDDTPGHRDNFLSLAEQGVYKNLRFHRIIEDFMIQGGDPATRVRTAEDTSSVEVNPDDTIPAEIVFPKYYHKKGALAAARMGDAGNPGKASNAFQFYIITGEKQSDDRLSEFEEQRYQTLVRRIFRQIQQENVAEMESLHRENKREEIKALTEKWIAEAEGEANKSRDLLNYSEEQRQVYKTLGGTPHLDNEYTVFGEVIEGMDVVDKIQKTQTDNYDKPLQDIIMNVKVLK